MSFELKLGYQHPDSGDDPRPDPYAGADLSLRNAVASVLHWHYPGHPWDVHVSHQKGVVYIQIAVLMKQQHFILHIRKLDPTLRVVVKAGGEILDNWQIPRRQFSRDHFLHALTKVDHFNRAGQIGIG